MSLLLVPLLFLLSQCVIADNSGYVAELDNIKNKLLSPGEHLKSSGKLVTLGNSSFADAQIILLPEIHDNPASLLTQLLILAREHESGRDFLVLDESLNQLKRSSWELFSQKSLEIIAAYESKNSGQIYTPRDFEVNLKKLAHMFKNIPGKLNYSKDQNLWTLEGYEDMSRAFYGWDTDTRGQKLSVRNVQLTKTLDLALKNNDRIFVMLGARHVPELEYVSSQILLCKPNRVTNIKKYFNNIEQAYGPTPELIQGVGATLPIYKYLQDKKYSVVFSNKFYGDLFKIIKTFSVGYKNKDCLDY